MSATTCIECGARGTEDRNDGIVHRTILCRDCQLKTQPVDGRKLPCGCLFWREGEQVNYTYCSETCPTYLAFIDENRRVGNKITMEHGH